MPKGNDTEAHKEFQTTYGEHESASDLLNAHRGAYSKELREAQRMLPDEEATAALDLKAVSKVAGDDVTSATVRGRWVVFTRPDGRGSQRKGVLRFDQETGKVSPVE